MRYHPARALAGMTLGALLLAIAPHRADAQFGALTRRVKDKVEQVARERDARADSARRANSAATSPMSAPAAASVAQPARGTALREPLNILEITPELAAGMVKAGAAERAQARRRAHPAAITADQPSDPMPTYIACTQKHGGRGVDQAALEKRCGTGQDAMNKQREIQIARRAADARADSTRYGVAANVSPDSAGAAAAGVNQRQYGYLKERVTAFLVLAGGGSKATCMRGRKLQYTFSDAESAALSAHRAELARLFLEPDQVRNALYGPCSRA